MSEIVMPGSIVAFRQSNSWFLVRTRGPGTNSNLGAVNSRNFFLVVAVMSTVAVKYGSEKRLDILVIVNDGRMGWLNGVAERFLKVLHTP